MEHVLVTGGMGFIGSYVVELLVKKGYSVVVMDIRKSGELIIRSDMPSSTEGQKVTYYHSQDVKFMEYDYYAHIVHLAAWSNVRESMNLPLRLYDNNVMATAVIADMVLRTGCVKSVVFASSSAVESPESHYGVSKAASEMMMTVLDTQVDASVASLRFANVFGARQNPGNGTLIARFIDCIFTGDRPQIYGDGTQTRDYIYAGDVAEAILATMENRLSGVMNVCTGGSWNVMKVYRSIGQEAVSMGMILPEPAYTDAKPGDKASVRMKPAKELLEAGWKNRQHLADDIKHQIMWQDGMEGSWEDNHYIDGSLV